MYNRYFREDDEDEMGEEDDEVNVARSTAANLSRPTFVLSDERDTVVKQRDISTRLRRREAELQSIREDFLATEHGSDRESDSEGDWERQQIQKAMISQVSPASLFA